MKKDRGGFDANLLNSEIPPGVFSSAFFNRYDAIPMETPITEMSSVSTRAETGMPKMSEKVAFARYAMNPIVATPMKKPESKKYVFFARMIK